MLAWTVSIARWLVFIQFLVIAKKMLSFFNKNNTDELKAQQYTVVNPLLSYFQRCIAELSTPSWSEMTLKTVLGGLYRFECCGGFTTSQNTNPIRSSTVGVSQSHHPLLILEFHIEKHGKPQLFTAK